MDLIAMIFTSNIHISTHRMLRMLIIYILSILAYRYLFYLYFCFIIWVSLFLYADIYNDGSILDSGLCLLDLEIM